MLTQKQKSAHKILITTLFVIILNWKQPRSPVMVRMETNVIKSCVECCSAIEGDKVLTNLKGILLSERNQSQKF